MQWQWIGVLGEYGMQLQWNKAWTCSEIWQETAAEYIMVLRWK